jgi:hypothetical protein
MRDDSSENERNGDEEKAEAGPRDQTPNKPESAEETVEKAAGRAGARGGGARRAT